MTTVEIDPALAQHARSALAARGITATVVCGDGENGHAPNAPYDRVLCTAGCHWVPYAWVEQGAAGAVIVTPWQTPYQASALLRLAVRGDGTAAGRFIDHASFMSLRGQRIGDWIPDPRREREVSESVTALHPYEPVSDHDGCAFAVSVLVSGIEKSIVFPDPADRRIYQVLIYDEGSRSWATIDVDPAAMVGYRYAVRQHGTRRLWEEIESAHGWWARHDRPTFTDFGLTVGPAGSRETRAG